MNLIKYQLEVQKAQKLRKIVSNLRMKEAFGKLKENCRKAKGCLQIIQIAYKINDS